MTTPPAGYPEPYYAPGWNTPPPRRTDGASIAALVTGVLGFGPVALGLGTWSLARIRRNGSSGRGMAWAGIILGSIGTLVGVAVIIVIVSVTNENRPLPASVSKQQEVSAGRVAAGNCLVTLPSDGTVDQVSVVPCSTEHDAQVVLSMPLQDGTSLGQTEDQDSLDTQAAQLCASELDLLTHPSAVVTQAQRDAGVRIVTWAPSTSGWSLGDTKALCLAYLPGGGLQGSFLDGSVTLPNQATTT